MDNLQNSSGKSDTPVAEGAKASPVLAIVESVRNCHELSAEARSAILNLIKLDQLQQEER